MSYRDAASHIKRIARRGENQFHVAKFSEWNAKGVTIGEKARQTTHTDQGAAILDMACRRSEKTRPQAQICQDIFHILS